MHTLESLTSIEGKRIIVRCDLNVPLADGVISDDGRIRASLPTITWLIERRARVIIASHLGRPRGKADPALSLEPVAGRLAELLGRDVRFLEHSIGRDVEEAVDELEPGEVIMLENLRFHADETSKDSVDRKAFAGHLKRFGDILVSDGFGVMHRKQASVCELAQLLPSVAGKLVTDEVAVLQTLANNPERPYVVVLGGSKVSDKLGVIENLLPRVDSLLIGGGMAFTFLAAKGFPIGSSLVERNQIDTVRKYLARADELEVCMVLPTDVVVASEFAPTAEFAVAPVSGIENTALGTEVMGLDIGPETAGNFAHIIASARTVFWNGPMGVFEFSPFADGTKAVAQALVDMDGLSVVGGGDSAAAVRTVGFSDDQFGHISTGGGASLEYLEGKHLPGLEVLR